MINPSKLRLINSFSEKKKNCILPKWPGQGTQNQQREIRKESRKARRHSLKPPDYAQGNRWVNQCDTGHIDYSLRVKNHIQKCILLFLTSFSALGSFVSVLGAIKMVTKREISFSVSLGTCEEEKVICKNEMPAISCYSSPCALL